MNPLRKPFGLTLAALLLGAPLAAMAGATPDARDPWCTWDDSFTDPIEDASPVPIEFRDGPVCYVHPFPCEDDPDRFCNPEALP